MDEECRLKILLLRFFIGNNLNIQCIIGKIPWTCLYYLYHILTDKDKLHLIASFVTIPIVNNIELPTKIV